MCLSFLNHAIDFYTMYAIRQEKYEEFDDEPVGGVKATT